jgi:cytidylate kinase
MLANKLGFHLLDSGALYRITALAALRRNMNLNDEIEVAELVSTLKIEFLPQQEGVQIVLDGVDVSNDIRKEEVGMGASTVAAHPKVRAALMELQLSFRQQPGLVADGRDMGTTVFPSAQAKIFLTAGAEERAQRRYKQLIDKGESVSLRALLEDIQARDERDSQRSASPLKPADDALLLDSTQLSIEEVLQTVVDYVESKDIRC